MELRVLHILPSINGYGAERQIVELLPLLQTSDLTTGLLTIYEPSGEEREQMRFPLCCAGRKSRRDYLFLPRLVAEIHRFNPAIVHTHTHVGKYWGRLAAALAGVKSIVHTEHNPCDPRRTKLERLADSTLHRLTACIVTFFGEQRDFLARYERAPVEKIAVIPNGIRLPPVSEIDRAAARQKLAMSDDRIAIVVVGRMEYQKNHRLALQAIAALKPALRKRVVLHFMGAGVLEPELRKLTRSFGIEEHVRFHGFRSDVRQILPGADLLLMTSWFEGMPLTLIEAMIAGVPVISTPWTGARSMLGDGRFGFIVPGWEAEQVAAEIERSLALPTARTTMAARARQYVFEQYGIERMAEAHRQLYRSLAGCGAA